MQKNNLFDKKREMRSYGQIQTSVLISPEFYSLCKENHIGFSEAIRVGISIILAEKGIKDYNNDLNIVRRIEKLTTLLEKKSQELEDLKENAK